MKTTDLHCLPLLAALFTAAPASAQAPEQAHKGPTVCLRVHCGDLGEKAAIAPPVVAAKPRWERSDERDWQEHMSPRAQAEDYNCLLSVGFGGELRAHGYQGARMFGQTRTLNLRGQQGAQ